MLECGRWIANCQIVKPLVENQTYQTCLVETTEFGIAWLHLFNSALFPDAKARQQYTIDADTLLEQSFPGGCTLLQAGADDEHVYALFPCPAGQPLEERLGSVFTAGQALNIVRQVAECLSLAHRCGFWHGNLSPRTIFLEGEQLVLADFALSRLVHLDVDSGVDPVYRSPEVVRGDTLGPPTDLYSLGVLLHRLLTGEVPFAGDGPVTLVRQRLQGEIQPLPESLAIFQPVLVSLLRAMPEERSTVDELIENLDRLMLEVELEAFESPLQLGRIDELPDQVPEGIGDCPESDQPADVEAAAVDSAVERVMVESDVATRIEQRLKERAAALQLSVQNANSDRADAARMAAISRQDGQVLKNMQPKRYQQKKMQGGALLLPLLGVAVGAVLYMSVFGQSPKGPPVAIAGMPAELASALDEGRSNLLADDLAAAEKKFVALVKKFPGFPQPYNNLAVVYASQGQLEAARTALEKALATDEDYATVYRNLGTVYAEMARDSYGRALQLNTPQRVVSLQLFDAAGAQPLRLAHVSSEVLTATAAEPVVAVVEPPVAVVEADQPLEKPPALAVAEASAPAVAVVSPPVAVAKSDKPSENPVAVESTKAFAPVVGGVTAAVQEDVPEVVLAPEPERAEAFMQRWAEAWSAQNVETYLSFYADSFVASSGQTRADWAESRQARLTEPKMIDVTLEGFSIVRMEGDKIQVAVTQVYQSDRYADRTRKQFDLQRKKNGWEILRERSLGRVR